MSNLKSNIKSDAPVAEAEASSKRTGAQAIIDTLMMSGVEMMFGYPGGGTTALLTPMVAAEMPNVGARTELGAAWMSYGFNRIRKRAASACLTHCVGALHISPVVYAAKSDSTPFLMMDINLASSLDMREALQDGNEVYSALKPLAKSIKRVVTAEDMPLAVRQALLAANTGRPGPAVLDIAYEALALPTSCKSEALELPERPGAGPKAVARMLEMIRAAKQPIILVGAGVHLSDATAELLQLAELTNIPVLSTSWGGRGAIPDDHPLFGGVVGSFGWECANDLVQRADLWVAIGTTFSQMTTATWTLDKPQNTIHIDIDPHQLGKIFQPTLGVVGDAKIVLQQLIDGAQAGGTAAAPQTGAWLERLTAAKSQWVDYQATLGQESGVPINQYYLINEMSRLLPSGSLVIGDSGGHAFMLYRFFDYRQVTPVATGSRYMSLGASLPVAIGAKLAKPDRVVVSYHGDGGFFYNFSELSTASQYGVKVIVIIDNNGCLLANRAGMRMMGAENPWVDLPTNTDYVGLARALGVEGEKVTDPDDIGPAIERALSAEGSYVIDVATDPDTRVRRAIKNVVPILSDRKPTRNFNHVAPALEGSWPGKA